MNQQRDRHGKGKLQPERQPGSAKLGIRKRNELESEILQLRGDLVSASHEQAEEREVFLRAQTELEQLCERYTDLYEFAPVGYLLVDLAGSIRNINVLAAKELGYDSRQLVGCPLLAIVAKSDQRRWLNHLSKLRRHRSPSGAIELNLVNAEGQKLTMQLVCMREDQTVSGKHAPPMLRIVLLNVTMLRQAQKAAQINQERLVTLVRNAPGWIFILDSLCHVSFQSRGSKRLVGVSIFSIIHSEDLPLAHKLLDDVLQSPNKTHEANMRFLRPDSSWAWMHVVAKNLIGNPAIDGVVLNTHDITERVEIESKLSSVNVELEKRVNQRTLQLQTANEKLREQIAERRRLERQVLDISEREQERIAQELHDGLQQEMAGIAYLGDAVYQALQEKGLAEASEAAEISRFANAAQRHARALAHGLRPISDDPLGLVAALKLFAESVSKLFRVKCCFVCRRPLRVKDSTVSTHLYRIAQEAVHNAIRHGGAHKILIHLSKAEGRLCLKIHNNGKRFPSSLTEATGMGLNTMRYRAQAMGGTLVIRSLNENGTDVVCEIPLPANGQPKNQTQSVHTKSNNNRRVS